MSNLILNMSNADVASAALRLAGMIESALPAPYFVYGIPRGGVSAAYILLAHLGQAVIVNSPEEANIIVDDLIDSGTTIARSMAEHPGKVHCALFIKSKIMPIDITMLPVGGTIPNTWVTFPWERGIGDADHSAEDAVTRMLQAIGEDPAREGLLETPKRVVKAWGEWFKGYGQNPADYLKTFTDGAEGCDEMVLLTDIPVYSHCEHHVTPFIGTAHVAYIPNGKIVGLSKIARVVETYSRRLQVQERLTNQIANCLEEHLNPLGVAVVIKAKHFCMATRGVKMPNVDTTTSAVRGVFMTKPEARAEFMRLIPS